MHTTGETKHAWRRQAQAVEARRQAVLVERRALARTIRRCSGGRDRR